MTDIEILAHEVLNMRILQIEYSELMHRKQFNPRIDGETLAKAYSLMRDAEHKVQEMCKDILGVEEEE